MLSRPYFELSNRKFYYMFDPPHLLKRIRNNLFKHTFHFDNKTASWKTILDFFKGSDPRKVRIEKHTRPVSRGSMTLVCSN